ncbi:hypothetical protein BKP35_16590 [Anaerobacillus arseniciselenatis]|uniref:Uncharacterized protein n=1 Tax=Anaerobacillus arseniciselenatis TaxID=85682 RepID=A0A1S2LAG4_9BACI|nr:hypothetical protein [Anaerobacillus arseniciselenatis]OIJ09472.1 hypothetical protein BKP35_16590 [Anaerobacillus arseniciselenatis]
MMILSLLRKRTLKNEPKNNIGVIRVPLNGKVPPKPEVQQIAAMALKRSDETMKRLGYSD